MPVQSVLFEHSEDDILFTCSAILFNKRWVLLPAAALLIHLSERKNIPTELQQLETSKIITTNHVDLKHGNMNIVTTTSDPVKGVKHLSAKYVGIFSCKNIKGTTDLPLGCGDSSNSKLDFNSFLSLFFILDIQIDDKFKESVFLAAIDDLLRLCLSLKVNRGSHICVESTPFGCRELLSSYSQGIICNCVGNNNCFVLTDTPTAPGCEGSPIYGFKNDNKNSSKVPIGIVISALNWWRGEHTGLTLGAMLVPLLSQLLPKKWSMQKLLFSKKSSILNTVDRSIVQVFCGNGWGTGILIDKVLGIFVTGSHVVKSGKSDAITLKWRNKQFPCVLVYRTENTPVYDIAVLRCSPKHLEQMIPLKFSTKPAIKGENVLAAGYPIFTSQDFIFPVVTKGNVSLTDSCILHTTCCILAGSSGGAILRENGELLGVIVCHTTVNIKNEFIVYPKINMAIPVEAIRAPLLEYVKTKDVSVLKRLENNEPYVRNKWHLFRANL